MNFELGTSCKLAPAGGEGKELPLNKEKDKRYKPDKSNDCQKE
jgi:hypothetical protein